ncbi:MAG: hypothetical protein HQM00_05650 [Magnetococcales bacterium]|nr:hypothetical protein [Magnetococcales bacterium]
MDYEVLQIIPASGPWVERFRGDQRWNGDRFVTMKKSKKITRKQKYKLSNTHVQYDNSVVCFALVRWAETGKKTVEPMTFDIGSMDIAVSSHLDGFAGVFLKNHHSMNRVSLAKCQCRECLKVGKK